MAPHTYRMHAGARGFPLFEAILVRSIFIFVCAVIPLRRSGASIFGKKCAESHSASWQMIFMCFCKPLRSYACCAVELTQQGTSTSCA